MPRINISEIDNTKTVSDESLYNVVYIPGFSILPLDEDGAVKPKVPTLVRTVREFQQKFGGNFPTFLHDQEYSSKFATNAVPTSNKQFSAGDIDPSYYMALQLLNADIPVVYERINTATDVETINPSTQSQVGFIAGKTDPSNTTTVPTKADVKGEFYVKYEGDGGSGFIYTYWIYDGYTGTGASIRYIWKPATNYSIVVSEFNEDSESAEYGKPLELEVDAISAAIMYSYLESDDGAFRDTEDNLLYDRNATQIKYLTTGGYPVFEYIDNDTNVIFEKMKALASPAVGRGGCIVLLDHTINEERPLFGEQSVFYSINTDNKINCSWAAMFTPGVYFGSIKLPGSFAYLISMAKSVETNPNWLAVAGVNRAVVPGASGLATTNIMTRSIADSYMTNAPIDADTDYSTFINPITNVRPYGLTVWGNRTLIDTQGGAEQALYYLNMRSLVSEIKKRCYSAAEQLMFEQNSDVLWINFKSKVVPLLDEMASSYGISGYKIVKQVADSGIQLKALIKVYPIYAVEDFDITVMLTKDEVSVDEE